MANKSTDEPALMALQSFSRGDYKQCMEHLNRLEAHVGPSNLSIQHNKALVELYYNDMKPVEYFKNVLSQLMGVAYPETEVNDIKLSTACLNYAIILYHARYYAQSHVVLDKLMEGYSTIKDVNVRTRTVMLLMEVCMARRYPDKVLELAKTYELLKVNPEMNNIFQRLIYRATVMLNPKTPYTTVNNSIQWLFLLAHHQYLNGDAKSSVQTLGLYKNVSNDYTLRKHGEDIWAAINNDLGILYLVMNKHNLAVKYFQQSVKEYFKGVDSVDGKRLIVMRDRPVYVFNLGLALLRANRPDGAFECLVEAARHYPNNPRLWLRLAECCVKHSYNENSQKFIVKKIGSGAHTRLVLSRSTKEKYSNSGESFAIPSLSLEFAALCLRNAIALIPPQEPPSNPNTPVLQAAPSSPLTWKQRCHLKNSILIMNSFVLLQLQDPLASLKFAKDLLSSKEGFIANSHKALAHLYAAESLINLDRLTEAVEHLNPQMIHDIVSVLTPQMQDKIGVGIWANTAVCHILKGDLATANKILSQINSARVLPLLLYMEMCAGNIENCHKILRKYRVDTI